MISRRSLLKGIGAAGTVTACTTAPKDTDTPPPRPSGLPECAEPDDPRWTENFISRPDGQYRYTAAHLAIDWQFETLVAQNDLKTLLKVRRLRDKRFIGALRDSLGLCADISDSDISSQINRSAAYYAQ